jgi:hypothetical protein
MQKERTKKIQPGDKTEFVTSNLEVIDNVLWLKDIRPDGSFFYVDYLVDKLDYWQSPLKDSDIINDEGTLVPDEGISLILDEYIEYQFLEDYVGQKKTIEFTYRPQYTGLPTEKITMVSLIGDIDDSLDTIKRETVRVTHNIDGRLEVIVKNKPGDTIARADIVFDVEADEEYHIAITIDNTKSVNQQMIGLFINGVSQIFTGVHTGLRLINSEIPTCHWLRIGNDLLEESTDKYITIKYIVLFKEILYIESFIPVEEYPISKYSLDDEVAIIKDVEFSIETLLELEAFTSTDNVRFTFLVKDNDIWIEKTYDEVIERWVVGNELFDSSIDYNILNRRRLYHLHHKPYKMFIKVYLRSEDGFVREHFNNAIFRYIFYRIDIPEKHRTLIHGLVSGSSERRADFRIVATLNYRTVYANSINLFPETKEAITDERMYWEMLLLTTDEMPEEAYYIITINKGDQQERKVNVKIPKVDEIEFEDLVENYSVDIVM